MVKPTGTHSFSGTIFDAALDASIKKFWSQESTFGSLTPRLWTQGRHIERLARLFGIGADSNERQREEVTQILKVPGQVLHDSITTLNEASGIMARGKVISNLLDTIPITATIFERLAEIGAGAGLWPAPLYCDSISRWLRSPLFRSIRTRGSPNKNGAVCCHNYIQ